MSERKLTRLTEINAHALQRIPCVYWSHMIFPKLIQTGIFQVWKVCVKKGGRDKFVTSVPNLKFLRFRSGRSRFKAGLRKYFISLNFRNCT